MKDTERMLRYCACRSGHGAAPFLFFFFHFSRAQGECCYSFTFSSTPFLVCFPIYKTSSAEGHFALAGRRSCRGSIEMPDLEGMRLGWSVPRFFPSCRRAASYPRDAQRELY